MYLPGRMEMDSPVLEVTGLRWILAVLRVTRQGNELDWHAQHGGSVPSKKPLHSAFWIWGVVDLSTNLCIWLHHESCLPLHPIFLHSRPSDSSQDFLDA